MEKSANKRWRESGSTLSFKQWVDRENKKKNQEITSFIEQKAEKEELIADEMPVMANATGDNQHKTFLGLNQTVLIVSGLLILGATSFYFYKKYKNK